jgi:hypothetical protein
MIQRMDHKLQVSKIIILEVPPQMIQRVDHKLQVSKLTKPVA